MTQALPARIIGDSYCIESELDRGGMGIVYAAVHLPTQRRVALKLVRDGARDPHKARARLLLEARSAAAIRHPHVVEVLDVGIEGDELFLVMELLEGQSLQAMLGRVIRVSPAQALAWLAPIMDALQALHQRGVVHRDIKPGNIFLSEQAGVVVPKLLDFGLARGHDDSRVTAPNVVLGTAYYMAPEQAAGAVAGPSADVWSLGCVLYECVAGEGPLPQLEPGALAVQLVLGRTRPLRTVAPDVHPAFAAAIERALRRDAEQRYASMAEMSSALRVALEESLRSPSFLSGRAAESESTRALRNAETQPLAIEAPARSSVSAPIAAPASRKRLWLALGASLAALLALLIALRPQAKQSSQRAGHDAPQAQPGPAPKSDAQRPHVAHQPLVMPFAPAQHEEAQPLPAPRAQRPREPAARARVKATRPVEALPAPAPRARSKSGVETEWL